MAIPINIEKLLGGNTVENNRIELKGGWNPDSIYRTICAFANDFEDNGSGYIIVGVDENNGRPVRPVRGVPIETIDKIEKEMVGFNNLFEPFYMPRVSVEDIDGKKVIVIWALAGDFIISVPCHRDFVTDELVVDKNGNVIGKDWVTKLGQSYVGSYVGHTDIEVA